jgi:hypothetical protein
VLASGIMAPNDAHAPRPEGAADLLREMYWARETAARGRMETAEIRDRLHDFAAQMRTDETMVIPLGEGNLASPSTWRRQLKRRLWRLMRPATWRYDRLLGDHAELTMGLAEKVMLLEAEVDRLRSGRTDRDPIADREDAGA